MSLQVPLLSRLRETAIVLETTTGSAPSYTASDAITRIYDTTFTPSAEYISEQRGGFGVQKGSTGAKSYGVTLKHRLFGAASLPQWTRLWQGCGLTASTSNVFSPSLSVGQTLTIVQQIAGTKKVASGCMGNAVFTGTRGQPVVAEYNFTGKWSLPATQSKFAPTYDTTIAPPVAGCTLTIGTSSYQVNEVKIDLGNEVQLVEDVADATDATLALSERTGYAGAHIVDRNPKITIAPLALLAQNWSNEFISSTEWAFQWIIGTGTANKITFDATKIQLMSDPTDGERNKMFVKNLEFAINEDAFSATVI